MLLKMSRAFILLVLLIAACSPQSEVAELPTVAVLPSLTPSNTPTLTNTPTNTPTPTATLTPTDTSTPLPTLTFTPSVTVTSSLTPTFTVTSTFTLTPTNTATLTPTITATPNLPSIISFAASTTAAQPGTSVTLTWSAVADSARIDQLDQQGTITQTFSVVPSGQLPVSLPSNSGRQVVYRLVAIRGGQQAQQSIPIQITCAIPWFFGDQYAPPDSGCPAAVGAVGTGYFQQFERGQMIWVNANSLNTVFGMQNDGNRYISYVAAGDGSGISYDDPPSGLFKPRDQFRWAFVNTLAPVGTWQNAIGWGTSDINRDSRTIQYETSGAFYIDAPTGVFRFSGGDSGTWTKIR